MTYKEAEHLKIFSNLPSKKTDLLGNDDLKIHLFKVEFLASL